ncbi:MAG: RNA-binding protein, partial [Chloroflexota bacterium]
ELIETIAKFLADRPDQVRVTEVSGEQSVIIQLRVAPQDMGRIIGRDGEVAKAMRELLRAVAARRGKRATLEII